MSFRGFHRMSFSVDKIENSSVIFSTITDQTNCTILVALLSV